ncbi:hypothetical protein [Nitrospirillum amazonense]|uniref:hypothetical protein n=1 Tax=Nitrospirillum amazonense TaxID=28077 RepID=UPI0016467AD9|nr:hypothetical protein [Nitrospirillum amazonense]MDG3442193.1 hypothetical protein [Nitrospirillum amazonense]
MSPGNLDAGVGSGNNACKIIGQAEDLTTHKCRTVIPRQQRDAIATATDQSGVGDGFNGGTTDLDTVDSTTDGRTHAVDQGAYAAGGHRCTGGVGGGVIDAFSLSGNHHTLPTRADDLAIVHQGADGSSLQPNACAAGNQRTG